MDAIIQRLNTIADQIETKGLQQSLRELIDELLAMQTVPEVSQIVKPSTQK